MKYGVNVLICSPSGVNLKDALMSKHVRENRRERLSALGKIMNEQIVNPLRIVDCFYVQDDVRTAMNGRNSDTRDIITEGGVVFKFSTGRVPKLITFFIARPKQLQFYYEETGRKVPENLISISSKNQEMGLNKL